MNDQTRKDLELAVGKPIIPEVLESFSEEQTQIIKELLDKHRCLLQIISGISHDINNALTPIFGSLYCFSQPDLDDHQKRLSLFKKTEINQIQVCQLMSEILCLSNGLSTKAVPTKQQLYPLLYALTNAWQENSCGPNALAIKILPPEDENLEISVVSSVFHRITYNIFQNAARYADPEKTDSHLMIDAVRNNGTTIVRFSDNGIGIDQDNLQLLFHPEGRQILNGTCQKGYGIGLLSCKYLTENILSGRIFVDSQKGIGTTVSIVLPAIAESPVPN